MTNKEKSRKAVEYWINKSAESLEAARRDIDAGSLSLAVTRLYYSAFYIISAYLLNEGLSFKKHTGVRSSFHSEIIKKGLIDTTWGKFYDRLFEDRHEGDYIEFIKFEKSYLEEQYSQCEEFIKHVRDHIK